MNEINYILVDNLGLATYRFVLANGAVGEFVDQESTWRRVSGSSRKGCSPRTTRSRSGWRSPTATCNGDHRRPKNQNTPELATCTGFGADRADVEPRRGPETLPKGRYAVLCRVGGAEIRTAWLLRDNRCSRTRCWT